MNAMTQPMSNSRVTTEQGLDLASMASAAEVSRAAVPLKPTAPMLAAGSRAGGVSVEIAWKIYLAMIRETECEQSA